ncbi:phage major capsid protein, partial [Pseudomonas monteilii]|nr:phage major capsid protein [Pseudomonas monteilii]
MDFEAQVKELNASLKGIGDQIKSQAEATEKQIKASGEMNT